jgi:hypothetical protein
LDGGVGPGRLGDAGDGELPVDHDHRRRFQLGELGAHCRPRLVHGQSEQRGPGPSPAPWTLTGGQSEGDIGVHTQPPPSSPDPGAVEHDHRRAGWATGIDPAHRLEPGRDVGHRLVRTARRSRRAEAAGHRAGTGERHLTGQLGQIHREPVGAAAPGQIEHQQQRGKYPPAVAAAHVGQLQAHHPDRGVDPAGPGALALAGEILHHPAPRARERGGQAAYRQPPRTAHTVDELVLDLLQRHRQRRGRHLLAHRHRPRLDHRPAQGARGLAELGDLGAQRDRDRGQHRRSSR